MHMNNEVRVILKNLVQEYGDKLSINTQHLELLLRGLCGQYQREVNVLVAAVRATITEQILHLNREEVDKYQFNNMVRKLYESEGIAEEFAKWSVASWCYALGKQVSLSSKTENNHSKNAGIKHHGDIKIIGIGGGGTNFINRVSGVEIENAEFMAVSTNLNSLNKTNIEGKLVIGKKATRGLGSSADPKLGELAAKENIESIISLLKGSKLVVLCAGMGGGTGTGTTPIIAETAKQMGIYTVAIVTKPFTFEGKKRADNALEGINKLRQTVDHLTVISNDSILDKVERNTPMSEAFKLVDQQILESVIETINDFKRTILQR
jgi:hypothetical protein